MHIHFINGNTRIPAHYLKKLFDTTPEMNPIHATGESMQSIES